MPLDRSVNRVKGWMNGVRMGRGKECLYTERMFGLTEKSPTVVTALYSVIVVLN